MQYNLKTNAFTIFYPIGIGPDGKADIDAKITPTFFKGTYMILDKGFDYNSVHAIGDISVTLKKYYVKVEQVYDDFIDISLEIIAEIDGEEDYSYEDLNLINEALREYLRRSGMKITSPLNAFGIKNVKKKETWPY